MKTIIFWTPSVVEVLAKKALKIFITATKIHAGRPKTIWLSVILNDINSLSNVDRTQKQDIEKLRRLC